MTLPYFFTDSQTPHRSAIEQGRVKQATSLLYDHLLDFIGTYTFEELCREWVSIKAEVEEFPFLPELTGSFWSKQAQVDVLAINWRTEDILMGECKWGQKPASSEVIQTLVDKTDKVLPGQGTWQVHLAFFARSGFTPAAKALAQKHQAHLVTLAQRESDMQRWLKTQEGS